MNKNLVMGVVAVLVVGGLGAWYINLNKVSKSNSESETALPMPVQTATTGNTVELTVAGDDFKFVPAEIKVKKGDIVRVQFKNTGGFHDFVIDEFNVKTAQLKDGAEETVEFVADKAGTFEYYCSVGKHRQMGMVGKLIVE